MANNEIRLPETLMVKDTEYKVPAEKKMELVSQAKRLLGDYDYRYTDAGLATIFSKWADKKGWLIELFSKHPNYNGNFQIVLPSKLRRPVDMDGVMRFMDWAKEQFRNKIPEVMIGMFTAQEYTEMMRRVDRIVDSFYSFPEERYAVYRGKTQDEWNAELRRMKKVIEKAKARCDGGDWRGICRNNQELKIAYADYRRINAFEHIINHLLGRCNRKDEPNIISEFDCSELFEYATMLGVPMTKGLKVAKYIRKILVKFGLDRIVDIQERRWTTTNQYGETEQHTRTVDMGYNHYFSLLGDSINPVDVPCELVISVNPLDFWTMSFGYKWASCHTIDKENRRNGNNSYHGCYSSGTTSYMLDDATFIVYSRPSEEQLENIGESELPMELQSKMKRCVFYLGEDKLVQSRLYPDGRDGGDMGLAAQFRNIIQSLIAELYETSNLWVLKKGIRECSSVVDAGRGATNYPDYENYEDCNVSYLRRVDGLLNTKTIQVGTAPICPVCGEEHREQEWITCDDCRNIRECAHCGCVIERGDGIYIYGNYYCDTECAFEDGYVETEDDGWHCIDDCRHEDATGEWYYFTDEGVETTDGEWFHDADAASYNGYVYCEYDDEWTPEDDAYEIGDTGEYFNCQNYDYIEAEDGMYFPDAETAEDNGYHRLEDGEWTNEEVA